MGIYKRKQESKKKRKQELDQESDQEKRKKTRSRPRNRLSCFQRETSANLLIEEGPIYPIDFLRLFDLDVMCTFYCPW